MMQRIELSTQDQPAALVDRGTHLLLIGEVRLPGHDVGNCSTVSVARWPGGSGATGGLPKKGEQWGRNGFVDRVLGWGLSSCWLS
jgi:hypothetical protein